MELKSRVLVVVLATSIKKRYKISLGRAYKSGFCRGVTSVGNSNNKLKKEVM